MVSGRTDCYLSVSTCVAAHALLTVGGGRVRAGPAAWRRARHGHEGRVDEPGHQVYVLVVSAPADAKVEPQQQGDGLEFLGVLGARWPTFLPAARAASVAASAAATADNAVAAVATAAAAPLAPPPAAPILLPASNTAAAIDLGAMTKTEQRALLARLVGLQAALLLPCSARTRGCLFSLGGGYGGA